MFYIVGTLRHPTNGQVQNPCCIDIRRMHSTSSVGYCTAFLETLFPSIDGREAVNDRDVEAISADQDKTSENSGLWR